jgi:hypothetical protein
MMKYALLSIIALAGSANAAVTTLAVWRGGEDDAGATGGGTSSSTTGIMGGNTLAVTGTSPLYSNAITAPGSTMSLELSGDDLYSASTPVTLTNNVGMEAWVRPTSLNAFDFAISNGRTGNGGYGIVQSGGFWLIVHGNVQSGTAGAAVQLNTWQHVAYVRDNGVSTLYVNGVATGGTISAAPSTPNTFMLGANLVGTGFEGQFNGNIDHVRLFSFTAGQFNVSDLNYPTVVPEPSVALLSGLAGLALIIRRRR